MIYLWAIEFPYSKYNIPERENQHSTIQKFLKYSRTGKKDSPKSALEKRDRVASTIDSKYKNYDYFFQFRLFSSISRGLLKLARSTIIYFFFFKSTIELRFQHRLYDRMFQTNIRHLYSSILLNEETLFVLILNTLFWRFYSTFL